MDDLGDSDLRALRRLRHPLDLAPASVGERAGGVLLLGLRLAVLHEIAVHQARKMIGRAARGEPGRPVERSRVPAVWPPPFPDPILTVSARAAAAGRRPPGGRRQEIGRAAGWGRGEISGGAVSFKK